MNTFNAFQAVGFYTMLPLATQWMFANNYSVWGYILSAILFVGYIMLSFVVSENFK